MRTFLLCLCALTLTACSANDARKAAGVATSTADRVSQFRASLDEAITEYGPLVDPDSSVIQAAYLILPSEWDAKLESALNQASTTTERWSAISDTIEGWEWEAYQFADAQMDAYENALDKDKRSWDTFKSIALGVLGIFTAGGVGVGVRARNTLTSVVRAVDDAPIDDSTWEDALKPQLLNKTSESQRAQIDRIKKRWAKIKESRDT